MIDRFCRALRRGCVAGLFLLAPPALHAQGTNAPAPAVAEPVPVAPVALPGTNESDKVVDIFSITPREMIEKGKWPVIVLFGLSLLLFALLLYLLFVLRVRNVTPPAFLRDAEIMIRAGRYAEARKACLRNKSPAAVMTLAALDYLDQAEDQPDFALLKETIQSEGSRQARQLVAPTKYLVDIAAIAPLIGLFGTVLGMYGTFSSAGNLAELTPAALAYGVGQALMTTLVGLMVAIPAMFVYAWFRNRAAKLVSNLEIVGADLLTLFLQKR